MKKIIVKIIAILFVFSMFVPFTNDVVKAESTSTMYAYVNEDYVRTRSCPSTNCDALTHNGSVIYLSNPRVVEVLEQKGDWTHIKYNYWGFTYEGYMYSEYLTNLKNIDTSDSYIKELLSKGFPSSYAIKLAKLHAEHPNWDFEVSETNISLEDAVNYEYNPIYKNLISTSNTNLLSTDPAAYSNGSYVQFEPGWYAPSKNTINYYMDPRNFLDDNSIFMFEQLSFNDKQTEAIVQSLLNGSFLAGSYSYNGQTFTYANTFVEAGRKYGVSPVHLAARVLQEQGKQGSATINMNGGDGQTYYNYFNFNASGSSSAEIIANALSYAKKYGWNNPYTAIFGGAEDIADGYITNGQDTLYYQKFNVVGGSRFGHQYMANVQAPYSESYSIYRSYYNAGLLESSFTFKIPVYSNMIDSVEMAEKSNNNNLSELTIDKGILYPGFNSSVTTYTLDVRSNVSKVKVSAKASDGKASVSGTGDIDLSKQNEIVVSVKAENDDIKEYKITINKKAADSEKVSDIVTELNLKTKDNNISGFKIDSKVSDITNSIKKEFPSSNVHVYSSDKKELKDEVISTGQVIEIELNGDKQTYTVVVFGDTNGDGRISTIDYSKVKAHIQGTKKISDSYLLAADTSKDGKISTLDYSKIKAHIQGTKELEQ